MPSSPPPEPRLVCLGNLSIDDVVRPDGTSRQLCAGGDALYGALAAKLFLPTTEIVAPVGHDLPAHVRHAIEAAGFSAEGLPARACPSLRNRFVYRTADERETTLLSDPADFETLSPTPEDIPERFWQAGAFVILAMTLAAQRRLAAACRARGGPLVALDLQEEYIAGNEDALRNLIAQSDIFMPSIGEVRRLLGHDDAALAARTFAALGPRLVVIKLGGAGCLVHDTASSRSLTVAADTVACVDTTGCGDAFCCAFVAAYLDAPDALQHAARAGAVAAGFALRDYGVDGLLAATPHDAARRLATWHRRRPIH